MAATFTEITLEEMQLFLKRGFRVLRPKAGDERGEVYYDLFLSPLVAIRVWTSIARGREQSASVGQDAIRVQLRGVKIKRPLMSGKAAIVKRTQNWRNSLQDRIEDLIEVYEDREGYWESRAGGSSDSERDEEEKQEREREREQPQAKPPVSDPGLSATFSRLNTGDWGLRILGTVKPGDKVQVTRRDGRTQWLTVGAIRWQGRDRGTGQFVTLAEIDNQGRTAAEIEDPEEVEPEYQDYSRV